MQYQSVKLQGQKRLIVSKDFECGCHRTEARQATGRPRIFEGTIAAEGVDVDGEIAALAGDGDNHSNEEPDMEWILGILIIISRLLQSS